MSYTFADVTSPHTIKAVFVRESPGPTPTVTGGTKVYLKVNGAWVPLFSENA